MPTVPGHPLISKDPAVCDGRARIAGTRLLTATVWRNYRRDASVFRTRWSAYSSEQLNAALDYERATGEADRATNADYLRQQIIARLDAAEPVETEAIWAAIQAVPEPERPR